MKELAWALLRAQDVNVLVVDWVYVASFAYNLVVENYREVALQISVLINQMQVRQTKEVAVIIKNIVLTLNPFFFTADALKQGFSSPVLGTHCPACFRCFPPPTHLIEMISLSSSSAVV